MIKRKKILINGIVQGVGFRPFIYKTAHEKNVYGYIKNTSNGVEIDIEGKENYINDFLESIKFNHPKVCKISSINIIEELSLINYNDFKILDSEENEKLQTLVSPDLAICSKCKDELFNIKEQRRYLYSFINCTDCGPRFTIIKKLPYDRCNTTMNKFDMCDNCKSEYYNPDNRRFHAEPTCCSTCGPQLQLIENNFLNYRSSYKEKQYNLMKYDPLQECRQYLKEGKIIAVKGIGGFNLICNGKDEKAIDILRKRKCRPKKPLAVMMKNINVVLKYCTVNEIEKKVLNGSKMPIVLLKQKNSKLPQNIAFDNKSIGVIMPYSPLHCLLFDDELDTIIFTSGNISGIPRAYKNNDAAIYLKNVADYFLIHNREINMPVDDSVIKIINNEEVVLRSGRGYAPISIESDVECGILALGSQYKNTLSMSNGKYIFMSPYVGDMDTLENLKNFEKNMHFIKDIYKIKINTICFDMHPNYWSKDFMDNSSEIKQCRKIGVYHHHAHIVSCMFENNEKDTVIGIAFDGTGYGEDKNIWGGEFLICDYKNFKRAAHIKYMKMPGKDSAARYPWKMGISILHEVLNNKTIDEEFIESSAAIRKINFNKYKLICTALNNNINTCLTSSIGRLFDGVGSLLGFEDEATYEGEAAVFVENLADNFINDKGEITYIKSYNYRLINDENMYVIDFNNMIREILQDIVRKIDKSVIAIKFHNTIIEFSVDVCKKLRDLYEINKVVLSGGVFQNNILLINLTKRLQLEKFIVLNHHKIPCNDSGVSLGQLIIGNTKLRS